MPRYDAFTLLWLKMYTRLLLKSSILSFIFLDRFLVPLSSRNIEATFPLSSEPLFSKRFKKTNVYSFTLVSNGVKNTDRNHLNVSG